MGRDGMKNKHGVDWTWLRKQAKGGIHFSFFFLAKSNSVGGCSLPKAMVVLYNAPSSDQTTAQEEKPSLSAEAFFAEHHQRRKNLIIFRHSPVQSSRKWKAVARAEQIPPMTTRDDGRLSNCRQAQPSPTAISFERIHSGCHNKGPSELRISTVPPRCSVDDREAGWPKKPGIQRTSVWRYLFGLVWLTFPSSWGGGPGY